MFVIFTFKKLPLVETDDATFFPRNILYIFLFNVISLYLLLNKTETRPLQTIKEHRFISGGLRKIQTALKMFLFKLLADSCQLILTRVMKSPRSSLFCPTFNQIV